MPTKNRKKKFIGIFDSGFGGIDILRKIVKGLPDYNYLYLGDTARAPYGSRSEKLIYEFTKQGVDFLFKEGCDLIILACNTASSDTLREIQQKYLPKHYPQKKVIGVLIPAAEEAAKATLNKKIGIIATERTVHSNAFKRELIKLNPKVKVFQKACPLLVPIVEYGEQKSKATILILESYLKPLIKKGIDTLILGCTHYGILEKEIQSIVGVKIKIISESNILSKKLKSYLARHPEIEKNLGRNGTVNFFSTDMTDKFISLGSKFFGQKIKVKKIFLK